MRYPDFLKPGGTLGFIAPSFGCATEPYISCFNAAQERFRREGYGIVLGPNCYASDGSGKSSTPQNCGAEVNRFFTSPAADVLISCGGGETMCEDLPFIDFDAIRSAPPKWFMGYSDNTNLTFTLPVLCDTAAIYGPNAPAFGMREWHESLHDAWALLRGEKCVFHSYPLWERESLKTPEDPFVPYNLTELTRLRTVSSSGSANYPVEFSGRLIGGCLDSLINLTGTPYGKAPEFAEKYAQDGIIWFLESCELTTMGIRRALWQLTQAGWFRHVRGFIFGRPFMIDDRFGDEGPADAVLSALSGFGVPVVLDADIGHLPPSMPVVSGALAHVKAVTGALSIEYYFE